MEWTYNAVGFNPTTVNNLYGFIYKITYKYKNKEFTYYGKKNFHSFITLDALKNGNKRQGHYEFKKKREKGKLVLKEVVGKESNWKVYNGSNKNELFDDSFITNKEILHLVHLEPKCKQTLSYLEEYELFSNECLFDKYNLNANVGGRYFKGNIIGSDIDVSV